MLLVFSPSFICFLRADPFRAQTVHLLNILIAESLKSTTVSCRCQWTAQQGQRGTKHIVTCLKWERKCNLPKRRAQRRQINLSNVGSSHIATCSWNKWKCWEYRKVSDAENLSSITLLSFHRLFHRFWSKTIAVYSACLQSKGHRKSLFNLCIKSMYLSV